MAKRALAGVLRGLSLCVTVPALSARPSIAFQEGWPGQGERAADLGRGEGESTCRRGQGERAADLGAGVGGGWKGNHVQAGPRRGCCGPRERGLEPCAGAQIQAFPDISSSGKNRPSKGGKAGL